MAPFSCFYNSDTEMKISLIFILRKNGSILHEKEKSIFFSVVGFWELLYIIFSFCSAQVSKVICLKICISFNVFGQSCCSTCLCRTLNSLIGSLFFFSWTPTLSNHKGIFEYQPPCCKKDDTWLG